MKLLNNSQSYSVLIERRTFSMAMLAVVGRSCSHVVKSQMPAIHKFGAAMVHTRSALSQRDLVDK